MFHEFVLYKIYIFVLDLLIYLSFQVYFSISVNYFFFFTFFPI